MVSRMPDESSLDDIGYRLYVMEAIQQGVDQLDRGEYVTNEQAKQELSKWVGE
jgi:predicted transcriptional regulator